VVDGSARRVDVEGDVLVGVLRLEVEELRDDQVGDLIVDRRPQEDDPLVEQPGVDVERAPRDVCSTTIGTSGLMRGS
jgi:hypothetical protein